MRHPRSNGHGTRPRLAGLILGLLGSLALAPAVGAASPDANQGPAPAVVTVPMGLDCSSVPDTKAAKAAMRRYHVCEDGRGGVTPLSTSISNCGALSLDVANRGGGLMQWTGRITSSLGPFSSGTYIGQWSNTTLMRFGPVSRSKFGFTSDWVDSFAIGTGKGSVFGVITWASMQLWWGPFCVSMIPVDSHTTVS